MASVVLPTANRWFERVRVDDAITMLWEPHVVESVRCNIWHVRGRDSDLVIDTGMGVGSLVDELSDMLDKPVAAVATHGHDDHIGGHHEFAEVLAHEREAPLLEAPSLATLDIVEGWGADTLVLFADCDYILTDRYFVDALPSGYVFENYRLQPARVTRLIADGDLVDTGDRAFEVLHLPGHSPGSIGLWDAAARTLFSGDALYDGPLLDNLPESNIADYCATMHRLLALPVDVVHTGHGPSFGRERLRELCTAYLRRRDS